eukprot:scaffold261_cov336-Pavlova_lutheri.AAC.46
MLALHLRTDGRTNATLSALVHWSIHLGTSPATRPWASGRFEDHWEPIVYPFFRNQVRVGEVGPWYGRACGAVECARRNGQPRVSRGHRLRAWTSKACRRVACERQAIGHVLVRRVQGESEVAESDQLHVPGLAQASQQSTFLSRPGDVAHFGGVCGAGGTPRCARRVCFGGLPAGNALSEAPAEPSTTAADGFGARSAACVAHQSILCEVVGRATHLRRGTCDGEGSGAEVCVLDHAAGPSACRRGRTCHCRLLRVPECQVPADVDVAQQRWERRIATRGAGGCTPCPFRGSIRRASGGLGAASYPCRPPNGIHARERSERVGREAAHGAGTGPFDPVAMLGQLRAHVQHAGVPSVQASHDACIGLVARLAPFRALEQPGMDDVALHVVRVVPAAGHRRGGHADGGAFFGPAIASDRSGGRPGRLGRPVHPGSRGGGLSLARRSLNHLHLRHVRGCGSTTCRRPSPLPDRHPRRTDGWDRSMGKEGQKVDLLRSSPIKDPRNPPN